MTRTRTGCSRKQLDERGQCSREALAERICRAVAEGNSLHAAAARERVTVETLKCWLAEYEAFRTGYEKARAIGRSLVLDDVLALADSLPGTGRADIRLKLAARKWWAGEVWKTSRPETPAQMKARIEAAKMQRQEQERAAELEDYWERVRTVRAERERERRREAEASETLKTGETLVYAPKPEPTPTPKPAAAPPPASVPTQPQLVRSIYDLSAWPPKVEVKTMKDWDPFDYRSY